MNNQILGAPGWLSWLSVQPLISAQVMVPGLWDASLCQAPCWAPGMEATWDSLSLSLYPSPVHARSLSLSLSKIKVLKNVVLISNISTQNKNITFFSFCKDFCYWGTVDIQHYVSFRYPTRAQNLSVLRNDHHNKPS